MRHPLWFVPLCVGLLGLAGCRTDPNIALLERDLRHQEDAIYELEDMLEAHRAALDDCREENAQLREQLEEGAGQSRPSRPAASDTFDQKPSKPRSVDPMIPDDFAPPSVELPERTKPQKEIPDTLKIPPREHETDRPGAPPDLQHPLPRPLGNSDDRQESTENAAAEIVPSLDNHDVVRELTLQRSLTSGYNADGQLGDEGITVCLRPQDATGRFVPIAAPVSIVVLDPAEEGEAARVARWDFTGEQIASSYRRSALGEGAYLAMVWPKEAPKHEQLHLFVRLNTDDGRKLQVDQPIQVAVAGSALKKWATSEQPAVPTGPALIRPGSKWQPKDPPEMAQDRPQTQPTEAATSVAPGARRSQVESAPLPQADGSRSPVRISSRPAATNRSDFASQASPARQRPTWSPHRP